MRILKKRRLYHSGTRLCQMLAVSRSGYYNWCKRAPSQRQLDDQVLMQRTRQIHQGSRETCGAPRVHAQLKREGKHTSRKTSGTLNAGIRASSQK